jgi:hypothetical protein
MYGKLVNGVLKLPTKKIKREGLLILNPTDETLALLGYKPIVYNEIKDKEGFYKQPIYSENENNIIVDYEYVEITGELDD